MQKSARAARKPSDLILELQRPIGQFNPCRTGSAIYFAAPNLHHALYKRLVFFPWLPPHHSIVPYHTNYSKMKFPTSKVIATSLLLPVLVKAVGRVTLTNSCSDYLSIWPELNYSGPEKVIEPNTSFSVPVSTVPVGWEQAILAAVTYQPEPKPDSAHFYFNFRIKDGNISYYFAQPSLHSVIRGRTVEVVPSDRSCPSLRGGGYPGTNPYNASSTCQMDADLHITFCPGFCLAGGSTCFR